MCNIRVTTPFVNHLTCSFGFREVRFSTGLRKDLPENSHNDYVIHGMSLVTEVIDSCSQAGGVPQAMGDHGPTPCRRQKEEVDVPTFLLQTSLATSFLFDKTRSFRVRDCCHQTENPVTGGEDTGYTGEGVASPDGSDDGTSEQVLP